MTNVKRGQLPLASVRREGDTLLVAVAGNIDLNNSPLLRSALLGLVDDQPPRKLILNLTQVSYMDSSAIAVLVEMLRRVGKVVLVGLQPRVRGILEIARLHDIFKIAPDETQALAV
jgi:anti-sigma B factor antagonist